MHILMIFLDGIGLGDDDPDTNPFAIAEMPTLVDLTNGHRWLRGIGRQRNERAVFVPTDPRLGVPGRPQSGTGQATLLTGRNIPQLIGEHYGPRPNAETRRLIAEDNFFKQLVAAGRTAALLEAYPPRWHHSVNRGKRLLASFQQAPYEAGLPIFSEDDLYSGKALSGDWTGEGWRTHLGYEDTPVHTPYKAGVKLVGLSRHYDFAFHSHWMTDIVGHRGTLEEGVTLLERFDGVMRGVLETWDDDEGLVIVTSDHGNMERIGSRKHTENDVPTLIIGAQKDSFAADLSNLSDFVPRMAHLLLNNDSHDDKEALKSGNKGSYLDG